MRKIQCFSTAYSVGSDADGEAASIQEPAKKKAKVWMVANTTRFMFFGLDVNKDKPFTSRPGILLRGLPRQVSFPNFQDNLLNLRWIEYVTKHSLPMDAAIPEHFFTDMLASIRRNISDGEFSIFPESRIYWSGGDRILHPRE